MADWPAYVDDFEELLREENIHDEDKTRELTLFDRWCLLLLLLGGGMIAGVLITGDAGVAR